MQNLRSHDTSATRRARSSAHVGCAFLSRISGSRLTTAWRGGDSSAPRQFKLKSQ